METVKLGEVARIVDCEHNTAPITLGGKFFAVGTPAMRGNFIDYSQARPISAETFQDWTKRLRPKSGDILFAREAPVGPVVQIPAEENVAPGQRTVLIRPGARVYSRFLFYLLASPQIQDHRSAIAAGSTVPHLNVSDIRSLCLGFLPGLITQHSVGAVLGSLDDKITANQTTISLSTQMIGAIASSPENRVPLNELAVRNTRSVNPNKLGDRLVIHHSIPSFDLGFPAVEPADSIKSNKMHVERSSVLVSKLNPRTPRVWSVPDPKQQPISLASTEFVVLEPVDISQSQLYAATLHASFHHQLASLVGGTSNSHQRVKPEEMLDCFVPDVRGLNEAQIALLDTLVQIKEQSIQENVTLAKTRDELLPLLMNGKISVREAKQEATSAGADIPSEEIEA